MARARRQPSLVVSDSDGACFEQLLLGASLGSLTGRPINSVSNVPVAMYYY
jgi:hypothetical protein